MARWNGRAANAATKSPGLLAPGVSLQQRCHTIETGLTGSRLEGVGTTASATSQSEPADPGFVSAQGGADPGRGPACRLPRRSFR